MIFNPTLHTLSNGIAVILDPMDIATTSVDVSFGVGARDENPDQYGITHFIEHILVKGTARFPSSLAIDEHLEDFGGTYNASTGNNNMRAYGRILSENINVLIDLLGDLVQNSLFDEKVLDNERRVIADELRRSLDNPDRCMYYFSAENIFAGSGMAHNTLGTFDTIANMSRDEMIGFMKSHISSKNTIITVGGKIEDADKIIALLEKTFGWIPTFDVPVNDAATVFTTVAHNSKPEQNQVKLRLFFQDPWPKTLEYRFQNMCIGQLEMALERRLHEKVRNQNGLVYGIGIGGIGNEHITVNSINTSTAPENLEKVVRLAAETSREILNEKKFSQAELDRFKMVNKFGDANWLESVNRRMGKLTDFYRKNKKLYDFYNVLEMERKLTVADVIENSKNYFSAPISVITQGRAFDADLKTVWETAFGGE